MNGKTQLVGILGWPVTHSKSPTMHNAAFAHLNLDFCYVPLPVNPRHTLKHAVDGLVACGFRGANVTVPYKEQAAQLVDSISDEAKAIGAVNTLIFHHDGMVQGENTDAQGFLDHLFEEGVDVSQKTVLLIGAGGAARSIVYALSKAGASKILIINRTPSRALDFTRYPIVEVLDWSDSSFAYAAKQASLVVNATSLGLNDTDLMPWNTKIPFSNAQIVYDLIYSDTPLLQKAKSDGARAISGGGMLLWQGALAFELWTGKKAPIEIMRQELSNA